MIELLPYIEFNGTRTLSDDVLKEVFATIKREGTLATVFCDGKVSSPEDFIFTMKNPNNIVAFILLDGQIKGFAWLNGCSDNYAFAHFCFFKEVWGKAEAMGKAVLDYWFKFPGVEGPLFDLILGLMPKFNQRAQKFVERLGFVRVGEIPKMAVRGTDRVPSVVSYLLRTQ